MSDDDYEVSKIKVTGNGSTQQLWNMLQGKYALATNEVVLLELRESHDRVTSALTYYLPYEAPEGDETVVFPHASRKFTSVLTESKSETQAEDKTTNESTANASAAGTSEAKTKSKAEQEVSSFNMIRKAVAQQLNLEINLATELLVSYMMFEYKASGTTYDKIADSYMSFTGFMRKLTKYYKRERMCLLLCTQSIFSILGQSDHQFFSIINSFCSSVLFKNWCWRLLRSIKMAQDDKENIEILHCLSLLMYKVPEETIPEFYTFYSSVGFDAIRTSEEMKMAEGVIMFAALVISGITDCCSNVRPTEFAPRAKEFLHKNFTELFVNPYNYAAVFAAYDMFSKDDEEVTKRLRRFSFAPIKTFKNMIRLIEHYGKGSIRDRNSLSFVVAAGALETFQILLEGFDTSHFGDSTEGYLILSNLLQHTVIAENFLVGTPLPLAKVYTEVTSLFPLDIPTTLHLWKSLCMSLTREDSCETLVRGISRLNTVAEYLEEEHTYDLRLLDESKAMNVRERSVYGIDLGKGLCGTVGQVKGVACVVWELPDNLCISALDIIRWGIQPVADNLMQMKENGASLAEFQFFDYCASDMHAIVEFLIQFYKSTSEQLNELSRLLQPVSSIMHTILLCSTSVPEKARLLPDLMNLAVAVIGFTKNLEMVNYVYDFLPGVERVSLLQELVLGYEGITTTNGLVTISFLNLMSFFSSHKTLWNQSCYSVFGRKFEFWMKFLAENIIEKCRIWRYADEKVKNELYFKVLEVFLKFFSLGVFGSEWTHLKNYCADFLLYKESFFIQVLQTKEGRLQDSIITPTDSNKLLPALVTTALKLLLNMTKFRFSFLTRLDECMEGWLVRILGRHTRHRLAISIPTTATLLLKEIAANSKFSLLASFSNDEATLRDAILQRLEFATEDVNLKIAVLDYLTVLSQTQLGLIQYLFAEGDLESRVLDLMQEVDKLAVPCLHFFRSMCRQRQPLPKSREDFWPTILSPLNSMEQGKSPEIITATMHILTFEMYRNGTGDASFTRELQLFLKGDVFPKVVEISFTEQNDVSIKSLIAVKHFITLILGRHELAKFISSETLSTLLDMVLEMFWLVSGMENPRFCAVLAELAIILATPEIVTPKLLSNVVTKLGLALNTQSLAVQLSMLCFVNKCYFHCSEIVETTDVENTLKILRRIFHVAVKILEEDDSTQMYQVLNVCATIAETIISKHHIDLWGVGMRNEHVPEALVLVANIGISKQKAPNVVGSCISALICLAEHQFGCNLVPVSEVCRGLYSQLFRFTETSSSAADPWKDVFYLCLTLNSALLASLKHLYLDSAIAFWAQHSSTLNHQIYLMTELTGSSVTSGDGDRNYDDLKRLLSRGTLVLNDVLMMMPFAEKWQMLHSAELFKTIRGVFYTLQEAIGAIQQPYLLQAIVGKVKVPTLEAKPTAKFTGTIARLWDICDICLLILMKIPPHCEEFIEKSALMPTIIQTGFLCLRALNKAADKRSVFIGSNNSRVISILEKTVGTVFNYAMPVIDDPTVDDKFKLAFRRDMCTDVAGLCDGIRRLALPRNDFLTTLCSKMETKLK